MKYCFSTITASAIALLQFLSSCSHPPSAAYAGLDDHMIHAAEDSITGERIYLTRDSSLSYHNVRTDQDGAILPWYAAKTPGRQSTR